jgi:hypothetical protein
MTLGREPLICIKQRPVRLTPRDCAARLQNEDLVTVPQVDTAECVEHASLSRHARAILVERPRAHDQQLADIHLEVFWRRAREKGTCAPAKPVLATLSREGDCMRVAKPETRSAVARVCYAHRRSARDSKVRDHRRVPSVCAIYVTDLGTRVQDHDDICICQVHAQNIIDSACLP